ncbi:lipopolysaccharide biosynthesis protein [Lysobacter cavernae]|uniref:Lipopolysaccharide biosynthesis protein n=1 Tax=Lysobacter cavernae TaxID=1685901 RepID=A0ABV7RKF0_9GAMM
MIAADKVDMPPGHGTVTPKRHGLVTHYLRYSTGSLLVITAGLVSFPILTRLLDNTQYGILGYYDTWVLLAVSLGKLGAQHAVLRFYPHDGDAARLRSFSTNLFYLPLAISLLLWGAIVLGTLLVDAASGLRQSPMFWLALGMMPMLVFASMVEMVLRASENSRLVMLTRVGWRWLELVLMLGAVLLLQHSAMAAYGGKMLAAVLAVVFFVHWARRHLVYSRELLDPAMLRQGMLYGLPLLANELIMVTLVSVDRLMLKNLLGDFAPVGIYTIGSSLAMQVNVFLSITLFEAFAPAANRLYDTEGPVAVRALKERILLPMTYVSIGIAALLWCFGTDVIVALSGHGKAASGPVFSWLGIVYALQPVLMVAGYGLLLEKRSFKVLVLMASGLLLNVALNLWWIPLHGVMGAVYATAVSSLMLATAHCLLVPRALLQLPQPRVVATAVAAAVLCVAGVWAGGLLDLRPGWARLMLGGSTAALLYALAVLTLDARMRALLRRWWPSAGSANSAG